MALIGERIPMYIEEGRTLDKLVEEFGAGSVSRRDAGNSGPLLFKAPNGAVFEIDQEDGTTVHQVKEARHG